MSEIADLKSVESDAAAAAGLLGKRLRKLRKAAGWTLHDLSVRSGVSLSTLSKIETAQVAPSFDTLVKAAKGLGVRFEALISDIVPEAAPAPLPKRSGGRLMVTKKNEAVRFSTPMYEYFAHANALRRKYMTPLIMEIKARSLDEISNWSSHEGEEFIFVLSGTIQLHTEYYDPVVLEAGDSAYIDSEMSHMFLNIGEGKAMMASICYSDVEEPGILDGLSRNGD